ASEDTETLIAIVSSLLKVEIPEPGVLLDAIVSNNGNVQAAANVLNQGSSRKQPKNAQPKKRKRPLGLDDWLSNASDPSSAASGSKRR
ncbi:hypothetical protein BJ138DRAFT_966278, partial [Hygrophoropsis aurantiaca]